MKLEIEIANRAFLTWIFVRRDSLKIKYRKKRLVKLKNDFKAKSLCSERISEKNQIARNIKKNNQSGLAVKLTFFTERKIRPKKTTKKIKNQCRFNPSWPR